MICITFFALYHVIIYMFLLMNACAENSGSALCMQNNTLCLELEKQKKQLDRLKKKVSLDLLLVQHQSRRIAFTVIIFILQWHNRQHEWIQDAGYVSFVWVAFTSRLRLFMMCLWTFFSFDLRKVSFISK